MLHVTYTPTAAPWLPAEELLTRVRDTLHLPAQVNLRPRSALAEEFLRQFGRVPKPYALRAWARRDLGEAWVYVDATETPESALWLMLHELAHLELRGAGLLHAAVQAPRDEGYYETDAGHEADPEEQLANLVATSGLTLLLGRPIAPVPDRFWWRAQVRRRKREQ